MSKELFPFKSFIHGSYIDPKICDALIEEHKKKIVVAVVILIIIIIKHL